MREMWCGAGLSGEPMWHVLAVDKTSTLCGLTTSVEADGSREVTDKHCYPCMEAFQAIVG